ncbi:MAG: heat-inducible transcription repressor HrcA, partial [Clostridia bacterium]|nr:heat-inducible transcription repressor HrcA [Clostridia bacterium]
VIDSYIETAMPVSSKSLTDKYLTTLSSATVRSELSTLEELGYLSQPHTSAGRIPSKEAYKLYVSELMVKDELTKGEIDYIEKIFNEKTTSMDQVFESVAKVISELTQYTSVAVSARDSEETILNAKLLRILPSQALLVIVTGSKIYKDSVIEIPESMTDEDVSNANALMEKLMIGRKFSEIGLQDLNKINEEFSEYSEVFGKVIQALKEYVLKNSDVILEGEEKILDHPEYADIDKIRNFLSVVTKKDKIVQLLDDDGRGIDVNIKIGTDGYDQIPEDCSLVTATYSVKGVKIGTYGVIGPIRMDYQKVVAVLENVGKILESIITKR